MKINEVLKQTSLTKKAITYYEQQGLINPLKNENGYREYSKEEIIKLKEIALYRRLDIPIILIKEIFNSKAKDRVLKDILNLKQGEINKTKLQQKYIDMLIKGDINEACVDDINFLISNDEKESCDYIKKELIRAFPGGLGIFLTAYFSPFLNEAIDSEEKYIAWVKIVEFLDNIEEVNIPKKLIEYYSIFNGEELKKGAIDSRNTFQDLINADDNELDKYKIEVNSYIKQTQEDYMEEFTKEYTLMKKELIKFFSCNGYYEVFIPNMKILSKNYKEYHEGLIAVNEKLSKELGIKYDEDMKIIRT